MKKLILTFALALALAAQPAQKPVYWLVWFDTEDYMEPTSDDAALRLAEGLSARGVRATFKIVGEKARVLESRGRRDVLRALGAHDIGYHTDFHSVHPTPAEYLASMGFLDGAAEFARRERAGFNDLVRLFGTTPVCYGQPGNSWGPQANKTLRQWGVKVYMDDGEQVGYDGQPFWYGGMLYVFNLGSNAPRANLNDAARNEAAKRSFDAARAALAAGGGVMQSYYHPTEWATTEFWDGVNFKWGANPERAQWKLPRTRTPESREQAFRLFFDFLDHVRKSGVKIVSAGELPSLFEPRDAAPPAASAKKLAVGIDAHDGFSAADLLLSLVGVTPRHVDGPLRRAVTTYRGESLTRVQMERARLDARAFIETHGRLPDSLWIGPFELSLADFAATLAADDGGAQVRVRAGRLDFERRIARDAASVYDWVIHTKGFAPQALLEMARLQAWTLKPARLR